MEWVIRARAPLRPRARLNLTPRLHPGETISSWMERYAAAYDLTLREFLWWLGYPLGSRYECPSLDLDVAPPPDLAEVLAPHAGIYGEIIDAHRLIGSTLIAPWYRRTFCPECWSEEAPYRRREWTEGWSLVCPAHRRLLTEKPLPRRPGTDRWEESWSEFYQDTAAWRDLRPSWQSALWRRICDALGVDAHAEFLRAWPWLVALDYSPAPTPHTSGFSNDRGRPVEAAAAHETRLVKAQHASIVKRDLALYTMIRFHATSVLQALDPAISSVDLIADERVGDTCSVTVPHASYPIRLFGAAVARHLLVRLTEGRWRCRRSPILEQYLDNARQWNDEDWWLERRICTWPAPLEAAGRDLLRKGERSVRSPPWGRCRECIRAAEKSSRATFSGDLAPYLRCRFTQGDAGFVPRGMRIAIPPAEWPGDSRPHSTGRPPTGNSAERSPSSGGR